MAYEVHHSRIASLALLLAGTCMAATPSTELRDQSLTQLEQRLEEIDSELTTLANLSLRSGTGAIGYRSRFHEDEFHREWIQIDFDKEHELDEVVLVPAIRRDTQTGAEADGFPKSFRLIAGATGETDGQVVAEYSGEQNILPRIAPFAIPCSGIKCSWLRLEVDCLSLRAFDEHYVLQLSEIMAFSNGENIALHQPVTAKSNRRDGLAWDEHFVVDGFVPYLMDAASGEKSVAFVGRIASNALPVLMIDLSEPQPVSRLQLHAVETSDFFPQALDIDFGLPRAIRLEGANQPDFADAHTLLDLQFDTVYKMSPIMEWDFPETTKRFLRLTILSPPTDPLSPSRPARFGFAEIELLSHGRNVARDKPFTVTGLRELRDFRRSINQLTDGRNIYGDILPIREWMRQLARRHDLETKRPLIVHELELRYEKQKINLRRLGWLSALLAGGIGFTILIDRLLRMRQIRGIEQRIAADLHDELGANLHTIGLLSDLAENSQDNPEEQSTYHQRIRAVTERSGIAVRNCTDMFSANALHKGLVADMERAAQRIMAKLDHELSIEGEEYISQLKRRTCFDLFLFYKECLVNISRHSGATKFCTRLIITQEEITLTISDNGRGLPDTEDNAIPRSLKRRAKIMGAKLSVTSPAGGGTSINLKLEPRKRTPFLKRGLV